MPNTTTPSPNRPKDFRAMARYGAQKLREILDFVPDNDIGNGFLKWQAGIFLKEAVPSDTLSGELLHRCIDQRTTTFAREDLAAINPELVTTLRDTMRADPKIQKIEPGKQIVWGSLNQGESHFTHDLQTRTPAVRRDLGRALGSVTIKRNTDGSFTLIDYFDFKNPNDQRDDSRYPYILKVPGRADVQMGYEGEETPKKLLGLALRWYENAGGASSEPAQLALGRIFCPEPADNKRGPKSIPVAITFTADEILPPPATPATARSASAAQPGTRP